MHARVQALDVLTKYNDLVALLLPFICITWEAPAGCASVFEYLPYHGGATRPKSVSGRAALASTPLLH